ncbi:MAG: ribonuclease R [Desulfuromonadales bacterium]|nr:ribonuclease R [Desulfuromonadales bacterium]NIR33897.1 ribonuclease R [Desulfuromonadales bacterium]NIS39187.1 ribonuclease R [Desulfuromonadales bacterium]
MDVTSRDIVDFLERNAKRPATGRELQRHFGLSGKERKAFHRLLDALVRDGAIVELRGNRYAMPRKISVVVGTVSTHRDGYGFVRPSDGDEEDLFIPARFMREAMNGDTVMARVERSRRDGRRAGRIIRVLERAQQTMVGRFEQGHRFGYVIPEDPRQLHDIFIPPKATGGAKDGQLVVARIEAYPSKSRSAEGVIIEVLGDPDDPKVEALAIVHKHDLPHRFPDEVLEAAEAVPGDVPKADLAGREDLRHLQTVTIDGETAKDFDDAVAVRRETSGRIRLWVSIADVAHYVEKDGVLDREAFERGTSVYFPGQCIPMLPEKLSNGICSLNPEVDRLTMTAEMLFDREGNRVESRFYPSVIRSDARLTYTQVRDMIVDGDEAVIARYKSIFPDLQVMEDLALRLMEMRRRRGSLDFDLPEAEIILDLTGQPEDIVRAERTLAHRVIEEFMLAANEAVAGYLTDKDVPVLYRVHEAPDIDKLQDFQAFVAHFNYGIDLDQGSVDPRKLQKLLSEAEGQPEEKMINQVLLRSMKQAHYSPENIGHFGLAADLYCHFTSPIRRYPDLVIHRILKDALRSGALPERKKAELGRRLPRIGELTSARERRAMEAEREIVDLKKCRFMLDHIDEQFEGIVSGVMPFGFFVELLEYFVEGLVHISNLDDDFYHYEEERQRLIGENRRRIFQVGEKVTIRVKDVNLARREMDFVLAGSAEDGPSRRRRSRTKGRS